MGVFLAMIRWEHAPQAIEAWANKRSIRYKLALIHAEAGLTGAVYVRMTVMVLDAFTSLSKDRNKLAHGFFGIVKDRENQFAWRQGSAAARRMAVDLASSSLRASPKPPTWIYTPKDFARLAQNCAETFDKIGDAVRMLPTFMELATQFRRVARPYDTDGIHANHVNSTDCRWHSCSMVGGMIAPGPDRRRGVM